MLSGLKNDIIWAVYKDNGVAKYAIVSAPLRDIYYLYEIVDEKLVKTKKKAQNPMELEKYIPFLKGK